MPLTRRRPIGAELLAGEGVDFRVWAPDRKSVSVVVEGSDIPLERESDGHFRGFGGGIGAGTRYRFRLDGNRETFPDPASRFQPDGPHGASEVVDPKAYRWRNDGWRGIDPRDLIIYEMHIGTFTREGTWRAAAENLAPIAEIGINLIEVMPVNEFPGRFGWGYDGVDLWAPTRLYGSPDDFRAFVDAAHALNFGVILDVVYNHFGPDGAYWKEFAADFFTDESNEWGRAINFEVAGVREFFSENAAYWIDEFHLDGLRLDATQSIHDRSPENVVALIQRRAREAAGRRRIFIVAENEPQDAGMIRKYGIDALWNDDWHHAAMVAVTGRREAYYTDYCGKAQEFVSLAKHGFLFQGQRYSWQKLRRGTPSLDLAPEKFVCFLQNHDQVANSATGARIQELNSPGRIRALTALLLLGPNTPMLFQGQEFAASAPFLYFADHKPELATAVARGRKEFMQQFRSVVGKDLAPPNDRTTFERSKLDHSERGRHPQWLALHRDLIRLRRQLQREKVDGAVLGDRAFVLRFGDAWLLLVNLEAPFALEVAPEPLLAPPQDCRWEMLWSSESADYGGRGTPPLEVDDDPSWRIPGEAAVVMQAVRYTRS